MRVTVYGNNATCPEADGACSSFLVETAGKKLLLDMGNGSLAKLKKDVDVAALDAIIISHLHFDHVGDLFCAKYQLESRKAYGEKIPPIPLFIPALPDWAAEELGTNEVFDIRIITDGLCVTLGEVSAGFIATRHLIETYGVRLLAEGRVLAYTGDSGNCPELAELARKADIFLCEATMTEKMRAEEGHHLCAATAGQLAAREGVRKLLLTHYHGEAAEEVIREAGQWFPDAQLTKIGRKYEVK